MVRFSEYRYIGRQVCDRSIRNAQSESIYQRDRCSLRMKKGRASLVGRSIENRV